MAGRDRALEELRLSKSQLLAAQAGLQAAELSASSQTELRLRLEEDLDRCESQLQTASKLLEAERQGRQMDQAGLKQEVCSMVAEQKRTRKEIEDIFVSAEGQLREVEKERDAALAELGKLLLIYI